MIDIHTHILPELDDGPSCLGQSVKIVKKAYDEGITAIVATPHTINGLYQCTPSQIINKCSLLSLELKKNEIPVHIMPGAEVHFTHETISLYDKGQLMTLNNLDTYILLELPPIFIMEGVLHVIQQMANRGIGVIIAHPERNATILKKPELISAFIYDDVLMQVTAMSIMGNFGKRIKKFSEKMISNDVVTFISSDIHPGRKFKMRDAYEKTCKLASSKTAERLFFRNPEEILLFNPQVVQQSNSRYHNGSPGL